MKCVVCKERPGRGAVGMCDLCGKSYDRRAFGVGVVADVIQWAAARGRRFEARRGRVHLAIVAAMCSMCKGKAYIADRESVAGEIRCPLCAGTGGRPAYTPDELRQAFPSLRDRGEEFDP